MTYDQKTIDAYKDIQRIAKQFPGRLLDAFSCFSQNQFDCKTWLIDCLNQYPYHFKNKTQDSIDIAILGGWYGLTAKLLSTNFTLKPINSIFSYDFDPIAKKIGKTLFPEITFIEKDITQLDLNEKHFSIVINTSCEHIEQELLYKSIDTAPEKTLFVLQSNNYKELQQHINCVENLEQFTKQYESRLENIRPFELQKEKYTRFMIMGVKK
tara:strand:+ start:215 stop:847 length:633 start_codon:yes stop_codon:yes gene_type:complete